MNEIQLEIGDTQPPIEYSCLWLNDETKILKAYDKDGKWITYEETDDPILRQLLSVYSS